MTEYEKMRKCMIYDSFADEIVAEQIHSHRICERYNKLGVDNYEEKQSVLREMFPDDDFGDYRAMEPPIFLDNYKEIKIGINFYSNIY